MRIKLIRIKYFANSGESWREETVVLKIVKAESVVCCSKNAAVKSGMREKLDELVMIKKIPVIGICVGMQMMANSSDEGNSEGLKWIDASVKKFDETKIKQVTRLPHMGWNDVSPVKSNPLFNELEQDALFYFLHSYYFDCNNPADILAISDYGGQFACAANHENIYGIQFHPEKSHHYGETLLHNFAKL